MRLSILLVWIAALSACQGTWRYAQAQPHGPACHAIDAALAEADASLRAGLLLRLAARPDLSVHEQRHLIDVTIDGDGFSKDKAEIFYALASNPQLSGAARAHLEARLADAGLFSSDQMHVASRLFARRAGATSGS